MGAGGVGVVGGLVPAVPAGVVVGVLATVSTPEPHADSPPAKASSSNNVPTGFRPSSGAFRQGSKFVVTIRNSSSTTTGHCNSSSLALMQP